MVIGSRTTGAKAEEDVKAGALPAVDLVRSKGVCESWAGAWTDRKGPGH